MTKLAIITRTIDIAYDVICLGLICGIAYFVYALPENAQALTDAMTIMRPGE